MKLGGADRPFTMKRWLSSTPRRTFVLYPIIITALEWMWCGEVTLNWAGVPLLAWGYLQYRWSGQYRTRLGGGGPGLDKPPTQLVATGIYRFTRNPMYSGHLIFMLGMMITFASWFALAILIFHLWWFHKRVTGDEQHMAALFGGEYVEYAQRVRRWGVI